MNITEFITQLKADAEAYTLNDQNSDAESLLKCCSMSTRSSTESITKLSGRTSITSTQP